MAIDDSKFIPEAPAFARSRPDAYYAWLTSNGFPHRVAYDQTTAIFGAPKSPEEQKRDAARQQQQAGFAQVGGAIGGAVLAGEAMRGFPNVKETLGIGQKPTPGMAESGTLSISRPVPPPATQVDGSGAVVDIGGASATPQVISTEGATSTIQTPTGPQQVPTESLNDPGFWSNVNWGQVAQGGLSLAQIYGAYQSYKSGDKAGAAIGGLAGAGNLAAATGAVATGTAAGTTGAYVIPGLNILAGAYGGYQTAEAMGDMAAGAKRTRTGVIGGTTAGAGIGAGIGTMILPGPGTAIGAGIGAAVGAVAGAVGSLTGSSKGKGQMQRDAIRGALQERGLLDDKFQGTLADGTLTDFGQDGSKLNTKAMNKLQSANPNAFEPTQQLGDAIAASYGFVGDKARSLGRLYVRGALSNAQDDPNTAIANMQHFAKQQGITPELLQTNLTQALEQNRITQGEFNRLSSAAQQLVSGGSAGPMPQAAAIPRPEKGQVARQSAGLYRDDQGKLVRAKSMKQALKKAYDNTKEKEKK
jgi:hypothetical protein